VEDINMKLTKEDIRKYGTKEEKNFLKEEKKELYNVVYDAFKQWVRKHKNKLSPEFIEGFDNFDYHFDDQDYKAIILALGKEDNADMYNELVEKGLLDNLTDHIKKHIYNPKVAQGFKILSYDESPGWDEWDWDSEWK